MSYIKLSPFAIFLDDERIPSQVTWIELPFYPWTIVRNYNSFVDIIKEHGLPLHISFDHDLGLEHYEDANKGFEMMMKISSGTHCIPYEQFKTKTGYHCALWLIDYCLDNELTLPNFTVHSMNPIGAANIRSLLNSFNAARVKS